MDPTPMRIHAAAVIARYLCGKNPAAAVTSAAWDGARTLYIETLKSEAWAVAARTAVAREDRLCCGSRRNRASARPALGNDPCR